MEDVRIEHRYNASHFKLDNHYENVYQMLLITNGRIRYRVGNKTYETGRGGVIVLSTLEEHELEVLEYPYERYLIRVQPDFFQNEVKYPEVIAAFIKRPPNFSHLLTVSEPIWNYLYDIVLEMEREYNNKKKYWELYVGADLRRIFIIIYRECADIMAMKVGHSVTVAYNIMNYMNKADRSCGNPTCSTPLSAAISRLQRPVCWQTASMARTPSMVISKVTSISSALTHEMQPTTA